VYQHGTLLRVGPQERPFFGIFTGPSPATDIALRAEDGRRYSATVMDPGGWFTIALPPGRYKMGMRYYIYLFDTPANIEVPPAGGAICVGTLHAELSAKSSFPSAWAATFGGVKPVGDMAFAVSEECADAPINDAGSATKRVMQLSSIEVR